MSIPSYYTGSPSCRDDILPSACVHASSLCLHIHCYPPEPSDPLSRVVGRDSGLDPSPTFCLPLHSGVPLVSLVTVDESPWTNEEDTLCGAYAISGPRTRGPSGTRTGIHTYRNTHSLGWLERGRTMRCFSLGAAKIWALWLVTSHARVNLGQQGVWC
jgi:hypothetical protein